MDRLMGQYFLGFFSAVGDNLFMACQLFFSLQKKSTVQALLFKYSKRDKWLSIHISTWLHNFENRNLKHLIFCIFFIALKFNHINSLTCYSPFSEVTSY